MLVGVGGLVCYQQAEVVSTGLCYRSIACFIQDCYLLQLAPARASASQAGAKGIQVGSPGGRGDWWQRRPPWSGQGLATRAGSAMGVPVPQSFALVREGV